VPQAVELEGITGAFAAAGHAGTRLKVGRQECQQFEELGMLVAVCGHGKAQHAVQTQHLIDQCGTVRAVIRAAERWRGIAVGEFEQRQVRAIRDELSRAHAERVAPAVTPRHTTRSENFELIDESRGMRRRIWLQIDDLGVGRYLSLSPKSRQAVPIECVARSIIQRSWDLTCTFRAYVNRCPD